MRLLTVTDSDIIEAIGFGTLMENPGGVPGTFGTLGVVFKSSQDTIYEYKDVAIDTFAKLIAGDSIGKVFHELFRRTKYPFTKSARTPTLKK